MNDPGLGSAAERATLAEHTSRSGVVDLGQLAADDPLRLETVRRYHYVTAVVAAGGGRTQERLRPLIRAVSERIDDRRPPAWVTLYRWVRAYERAGCDPRALVPATRSRGNRRARISGRRLEHFADADYEKARVVAAIADETIAHQYLSKSRPSVRSVYECVVTRILEENRRREPLDHLPLPHINSLYRRVEALDPFDVTAARYGRRAAHETFRPAGQGPRPTRPLERVECDHTRLDLMVVDPVTRLPLGRPWLTSRLDRMSRAVLGIYLGFHPPSYLAVMQCLRHAVRPKEYLTDVYPVVEHDWPVSGVPELLVVDNAKEFYSRHFEDACLQLGIQIDYAPPQCGAYKGVVERWFGTQNTRLLHELPGTTFSNIFDRGDYDPVKHALISLDALLELTHIWIVDVYHQQAHRGLGDIPHRRWMEAAAQSPPKPSPSAERLDVLVGCVAERRVTRSGIELFTLRYNSPELGLIRRALGSGERAHLKYDPTDLSRVWVLDPTRAAYVSVPALDAEYTRGLTLYQHRVISRYARRQLAEHVDVDALARARQRIEQIVARERVAEPRLAGRQKIARFLDLGQPRYDRRGTTDASAVRLPLGVGCSLEQPLTAAPRSGTVPPEADRASAADRTPTVPVASQSFPGEADYDTAREPWTGGEAGWQVSYDLRRSEDPS
jgi:putative transposase